MFFIFTFFSLSASILFADGGIYSSQKEVFQNRVSYMNGGAAKQTKDLVKDPYDNGTIYQKRKEQYQDLSRTQRKLGENGLSDSSNKHSLSVINSSHPSALIYHGGQTGASELANINEHIDGKNYEEYGSNDLEEQGKNEERGYSYDSILKRKRDENNSEVTTQPFKKEVVNTTDGKILPKTEQNTDTNSSGVVVSPF